MPPRSARAPWTDVVVVCGTCAKRSGRKGFRKDLKGALKAAGAGKGVRVIQGGCFGLCPKKRVTFATGKSLAAARLSIVAPDDATAAAAAILAERRPPASIRLLSIDRVERQP